MAQDNPGHTQILLATGNRAKQETLRWLLEGLPLTPISPDEAGVWADPDESQDTHEAIARSKATEWSEAGSMLAIASDGGLALPSLGFGWESRYTHRFAGPAADDNERVRRLLELMQPHRGAQREASWMESLAIAHKGKPLVSWELRGATGRVAESPGPESAIPGFWVFSLWHFPQFGKYYNELTPLERDEMDDHWTRLRRLVQRYFRSHFVHPAL
jgi:inosine/xanthosine triphosphate pyrophosphatase family protein